MKPLVGDIIEAVFITARVRLVIVFNSFNTLPTEALSTAGHLLRLSKDMEANAEDTHLGDILQEL